MFQTMLQHSMLYLYALLTILAFMCAVWISTRWRSIIFNSFVLTILLLVGVLLLFNIPYDSYQRRSGLLRE